MNKRSWNGRTLRYFLHLGVVQVDSVLPSSTSPRDVPDDPMGSQRWQEAVRWDQGQIVVSPFAADALPGVRYAR